MRRSDLAGTDLNLLVALDALLSEKNVTRAAQRIGRTQSATSHALARLRRMMGDPLLVRTPAGMRLTAHAEQLVEPARNALRSVEQALLQRAAFHPATARRRFVIMGHDYVEALLLPPLLARLTRDAPGIEIDVRAAIEPDRALEEGRVDLLLSTKMARTSGFYRQALLSERFVCLLRADHPDVGAKLSLEQYLRLRHVLIAPRGRPGGFVDDELARRGLARQVVLRVAHYLVAPYVVAKTDLCLTAAEHVARVAVAQFPLRVVELPLEVAGFTVSAFWHERRHTDPGHVWLRSLLLEIARDL